MNDEVLQHTIIVRPTLRKNRQQNSKKFNLILDFNPAEHERFFSSYYYERRNQNPIAPLKFRRLDQITLVEVLQTLTDILHAPTGMRVSGLHHWKYIRAATITTSTRCRVK